MTSIQFVGSFAGARGFQSFSFLAKNPSLLPQHRSGEALLDSLLLHHLLSSLVLPRTFIFLLVT